MCRATERSGSHPVGFTADLNADQRAFQSDEGALVVDVVATSCNPFLGALFGAICTIKVNLMRAFGSFGENTHLVRKDFDEAPCHRQPEPALSDSITKFTDFQLREKRRVTWQDAEVSLGARKLELFDLLVNKRPFGSDEREIYGSSCHL